MKAIYASYLIAITLVALGGPMAKASPSGDNSSEEFLIRTDLSTVPPAVQFLSDSSLPGNKRGDGPPAGSIDGRENRHAYGQRGPRPHGPGGPEGLGGFGGGFGPGGHIPPGPDPEFLKTLGLTDEQREKLHAIREKEHLASAARISELIKLRHQLFEAITAASTAEAGDAVAIQKQINNLDNANNLDRVASMLESKAVFTEEQNKQLRRHMLEHEPLLAPMGGPACGPPIGPGGAMGG